MIPKSAPEKPKSDEFWKDQYFKKNPSADTNEDGVLSWAEFHSHKKMPENQKKVLQNNHWKTHTLSRTLRLIPIRMEFFHGPSSILIEKRISEHAENKFMRGVFFLCIHYSNADIIYVGISNGGEGNGSLENPFRSISSTSGNA